MNAIEMKKRTKAFGLRTIRLVNALPNGRIADVLGRQLLRCGTSVGANYRAACRAQSPAHFVSKMKIVEEECDESMYWMELIIDSELMTENRVSKLMSEANELLSIFVASIKTVRLKVPPGRRVAPARNRQSSIVHRQSPE